MTRRRASLLLAASPAFAQSPTERAERLILTASRALQAGNAARFLSCFDRKEIEDYSVLREGVVALLETHEAASSVDVTVVEAGEETVELRIKWLLQLTRRYAPGPVERRQEEVSATVRTAKEPKIIAFEPVELFLQIRSVHR